MWFPLKCHSHFSLSVGDKLLRSLGRAETIADRLEACKLPGIALTDSGSISGVPSVLDEFANRGLKAIAGQQFFVAESYDKPETATIGILGKGQDGWKSLIRATSAANIPSHYGDRPRLTLEDLAEVSKNDVVAYSGQLGSTLANACFRPEAIGRAWIAATYEEAFAQTWGDRNETIKRVTEEMARHRDLFPSFFVEIQLTNHVNSPAAVLVAKILRHCARLLNLPCIATSNTYYPSPEDSRDHRVVMCAAKECSEGQIKSRLNPEEWNLYYSNQNYLPTTEQIGELHKDHPKELANTLLVAEMCGTPKIGGKPLLPVFPTPDGSSPDEYLRQLCRNGWNKVPPQHRKSGTYVERVKHELEVLTGAGLSSYFLIVQDYIRHIKRQGGLVGEGRGSSAGCLVSYLLGITGEDPIPYGLLFERFYNAGRNTADRVALPDIDTDFRICDRDKVITYLQQKYGQDKVCQMATYARMQGRGALKDVFRARGVLSYEEMNKITQFIPDESKIADELQEMDDPSIIRWAVEHNEEKLKEWVRLEDGKLTGPLEYEFSQAIRLEGTKRSSGKHPSGVIVCSEPLETVAPMVYDKSGVPKVGVDMRDAEKMGLLKLDVLGSAVLDAISDATAIITRGYIA